MRLKLRRFREADLLDDLRVIAQLAGGNIPKNTRLRKGERCEPGNCPLARTLGTQFYDAKVHKDTAELGFRTVPLTSTLKRFVDAFDDGKEPGAILKGTE